MMHPTSPPSPEALERLRAELSDSLSTFPEAKILGAQLGTKLNAALSPSSYKSWLNEGSQNLRSFAEAFLEGIVTPTQERQGLDYLFQIENKSQQVIQSFSGALWKAFCTVRPAQIIRFDINKSVLSLAPIGTEEASEGIVLPHISESEHKAMYLEFAEWLKSEGRASQQIIGAAKSVEPRFYSIWVATLKAEPGLFKQWGVFRVPRIKNLFSQRIQTLSIDETTRARLRSEFDADYESQRNTPTGSVSPQVASPITQTASIRTSDHTNRQVLTKALETLDDSQLAKILIPMDVVAALLAQRRQ